MAVNVFGGRSSIPRRCKTAMLESKLTRSHLVAATSKFGAQRKLCRDSYTTSDYRAYTSLTNMSHILPFPFFPLPQIITRRRIFMFTFSHGFSWTFLSCLPSDVVTYPCGDWGELLSLCYLFIPILMIYVAISLYRWIYSDVVTYPCGDWAISLYSAHIL
jgi:hypothetical protein